MTAPLTYSSSIRLFFRTWPIVEAVAPSATNTTVNPATNSPMPLSTGPRAADGVAPWPPAESSAADSPETMET